MTESPMLTEIWWRCPRCDCDGGFCGYTQDAINVLFGLCVPHCEDTTRRVNDYPLTDYVSCWGCGWRGSWKEAGCDQSPEAFC